MPQFRDFLDRFRPAPAPGAASLVGVAADRSGALAAELDPVLALLAGTHAECERMVAAARQDARQIGEQARQQASAITAGARDGAAAARTAAADAVVAAAQARASRAIAAAAHQVQSPRRVSDAQVSDLIRAAVGLVSALADGSAPG